MEQVNVVNRQLVAVLTIGTLTDAEMLSGHPDASYLLALTEHPAHSSAPEAAPGPGSSSDPSNPEQKPGATCSGASHDPESSSACEAAGHVQGSSPAGVSLVPDKGQVVFGACFIDVATSRVLVGQW